jgi:TonB dependent receptor
VTSLLLLCSLVVAQASDAGSAGDAGVAAQPAVFPDGGAAVAVSLDGGIEAGAGPDAVAVAHLRGRVLAKGSRGPALAAKLTVTDGVSSSTVDVDDDGQFDAPVACGVRALAVRAPGYEPLVLSHDACADPTPMLLRLSPRSNLPLYETVVVAPKDEPSVELRGPELTSTPGSLGDPLRTIESLPGVAAVAWPAPIYAIRGSNPGNTGYFLDDLQVPLLFHLALGPSVIHPAFFDSMSFYPGGYPMRYGRYVAGIVSTQTRTPAQDRPHAMAEVRLYDAGGLVSMPFPDHNGSVAAAFRYSYTGALLSLLRNDLHLAYWDYQLRADRRVGPWQLTLLLFGSGDDLEYKLREDYPLRTYLLQFHRASLRATRSIGEGRLSARLAFGSDQSTAPIVDNYTISARAYSIVPRLVYEWPSRFADLEAGLDSEVQWFRPVSNVYEAGASDLARNRTVVLGAAYLAGTMRAGSRLTLTPGLRLDSYTISGTSKMDLGPRLSARLRLDDKTWLSASGGRFSQSPSLTVQIPAAENFGLALYGLQTSWQAALGVGTQAGPGLDVEVTGYVQRYVLTDLRDPALINPDPLASDFLVRRDARSYGVEFMLRRPATHRLHGWLSYTLSQNQRALGGGVIGPSDWDQRHILNAVVGYRLGRTTLGARGHLNTGRPVLVNGGTAETFVRLPTFYQLDLRAERRFLFDAFTLDVYLEFVNATLTREVYQIDQDRMTGALSERSLRVVLPSLGLRVEM